MPFGTITATESTFGSISGSIVGAVPGTLSGSVGVPGPQGPVGPAGPQGPQGVPGVGGTWGSIVGTLSSQTDLQTALNAKYDASNPSGFITSAALTPYLTSATAASTYQTLAGMSSYLTTSAAASTYYPLSGNPSSFLTASALTGYATQSFVAANYAPIAAGLPTGGTVGQVLTKQSGTDYDDSWQTLIPGDRYLTTSTTSNSVSNGTKTFTIGTGLSYSSQQDVVISYDAANHMHAVVTSYNSGTGVLVVNVQSHTGAGTYTSWTVNVGGTTPLQSVLWGEILGTLGDQTDLATALGNKLETSTAASTYAALAGATFTGEIITPASTTSNAGLTITPGVAPTTPTNGEIWATTTDLQVRLNGVTETLAEQSWVTSQGYAPTATPTFTGLATFDNPGNFAISVPGSGTGFDVRIEGQVLSMRSSGTEVIRIGSNGIKYPDGVTQTVAFPGFAGYAALSGATFTGLVSTLAPTTATAGLRLPHGSAPTTPVNGDLFTTTSGLFARINGTTRQYVDFDGTQTINGAKTFSNASQTLGNSTATGTIAIGSGATLSGSTKTIQIGLNGVAGSTTSITLGSATGTSTTTLQGTTNGVTVAADTNSVALATTAYVVGQASAVAPSNDAATASAGTSLRYARADHVHLNPLPAGGTANQVLAKVDGTNYNTTWVTPSGGGSATDYQAYETAGTFTWTKPANAKWVEVVMFAGGGGGGSGARTVASSGSGGAGGGGGSYVITRLLASSLGATQSVIVGAGGNGGTSVSVDSTAGVSGSNGGNSVFFNLTAVGGFAGGGGVTPTGSASGGAVPRAGYSYSSANQTSSGLGGAGPTGPGTSGSGASGATATFYPTGGGGGAGNNVFGAGGNGGNKIASGTSGSGLTSAIAGGAGATAGGAAAVAGTSGASIGGQGGLGGGGGASFSASAATAGAAGGLCGGGGGGGGASVNGFASGAGGAGGGGAVYIITYC